MSAALWITRIGYALVVVSLLMIFEVTDFLPVERWLWLRHFWSGGPPGPYAYIRVVPSESPGILHWSVVVQWSLLVGGLAAIAVGRVISAKLRAK